MSNANNPGGDNNLVVSVQIYEPQVQCSGAVSPSLLSSCQNIIDTMPADKSFTTWGPQNDPLAHMELPLTLYSRKSTRGFPFQKTLQQMARLSDCYA